MVLKFKAKEFFIVDDTFTMIPERTKKFCDLLSELETFFIWGCESRTDIVDKDLLQSMYLAGCRKTQFGLESAHDKVLHSINKNITFKQVENATKLAHDIGFDINISVIIGHAEDTKETIEYTLEKSRLLKEKYNANMQFSINIPYPGTDLYENAVEYGIEVLTDNYDFYSTDNAIINTKYLTANDLRYYYNSVLGIGKSV
ncbi:B12-binding domain-containing radical SAM protein [Garciella nitratireducens]|uniref:B12-binding domain-containing radical SAM protein n=1 Tax=Garciella nitratireducens TaxID=218205 RepID=UPI0015F066E1|nr:radical SAM protein [Garciella nitratireducens]